MPSFHLKLQTKKSVKKWRNPGGGVQMTPPLGLRVTIFSLGLLGLTIDQNEPLIDYIVL